MMLNTWRWMIVFWSMNVAAQDIAKLDFIGFSNNYLAFQQTGVYEGQGLAYATLHIVDIKANEYAFKPFEITASQPSERVSAVNLPEAKSKLNQLAITGNLLGQKVIARSLNDLDINPYKARFALGEDFLSRAYTLTLTEKSSAESCGATKLLTLTLLNEQTQKSSVLQDDKKLPASRGCPTGYKIQDVYVLDNKYIAVFLAVLQQGFEGLNIRYRVVTGEIH